MANILTKRETERIFIGPELISYNYWQTCIIFLTFLSLKDGSRLQNRYYLVWSQWRRLEDTYPPKISQFCRDQKFVVLFFGIWRALKYVFVCLIQISQVKYQGLLAILCNEIRTRRRANTDSMGSIIQPARLNNRSYWTISIRSYCFLFITYQHCKQTLVF